MARSRVCACRGCEAHTGTCGWPTTNERRCDRCGRPGFANRFRRTPDHPDPTDVGLATTGEADGRGTRRGPRLALPRLASRAARGATRRARGRPSGAARPRWRAAAGAARRALRELQRAQGAESAAAVSQEEARPLNRHDQGGTALTATVIIEGLGIQLTGSPLRFEITSVPSAKGHLDSAAGLAWNQPARVNVVGL